MGGKQSRAAQMVRSSTDTVIRRARDHAANTWQTFAECSLSILGRMGIEYSAAERQRPLEELVERRLEAARENLELAQREVNRWEELLTEAKLARGKDELL